MWYRPRPAQASYPIRSSASACSLSTEGGCCHENRGRRPFRIVGETEGSEFTVDTIAQAEFMQLLFNAQSRDDDAAFILTAEATAESLNTLLMFFVRLYFPLA